MRPDFHDLTEIMDPIETYIKQEQYLKQTPPLF